MARKTNKEQVLTLAAALGVDVEYGHMGEDGFEVALYGYGAHMAFDPMGEGHTAITNQAGTGIRTEADIWGAALRDLREFVPCAADCHCRATDDAVSTPTTERNSTVENIILYVAGWNTPGCLPVTDPEIFDNETAAIRYLTDTVDRFWSEDDEADNNPPGHAGQAGKWADVYANLPFETAPFNIANNDRSLTFWVTVVPKSDLPYNA